MKKEFKVGDRVTCALLGEGKVIAVDSGDNFPIKLEFETGSIRFYTPDGRYHEDFSRSLFHADENPRIVTDSAEEEVKSEPTEATKKLWEFAVLGNKIIARDSDTGEFIAYVTIDRKTITTYVKEAMTVNGYDPYQRGHKYDEGGGIVMKKKYLKLSADELNAKFPTLSEKSVEIDPNDRETWPDKIPIWGWDNDDKSARHIFFWDARNKKSFLWDGVRRGYRWKNYKPAKLKHAIAAFGGKKAYKKALKALED